MEYIQRINELTIERSLRDYPVVALTGPRQCGKSTLVKHLLNHMSDYLYLDLERPSDLQKLDDPEWFFLSRKERLICIDEVQRKPDLFPVIRSLCDQWNRNGAFLILGSASRDLLQQSSESLAGRIGYNPLTPFLWKEVKERVSLTDYLYKGGFPRSLIEARDANVSLEWRENFIATFLERDLLQWRGFTPQIMRRLWQMLAYVNGQTVNYSSLGNSLGVSSSTVSNYIDLLSETYMLVVIPPYFSNMGKRLVKAPKVYVSDSGITTALLQIHSFEEMMGHPSLGAIWEQVVLTNLMGHFPKAQLFFYRTSNGTEMDFVMKYKNKVFAIECKCSLAPVLQKGFYNAIEDISPTYTFIVIPTEQKGWSMKPQIDVVSLTELVEGIELKSV